MVHCPLDMNLWQNRASVHYPLTGAVDNLSNNEINRESNTGAARILTLCYLEKKYLRRERENPTHSASKILTLRFDRVRFSSVMVFRD